MITMDKKSFNVCILQIQKASSTEEKKINGTVKITMNHKWYGRTAVNTKQEIIKFQQFP